MRVQAIWAGTVIAESERTVYLHGHTYFPLSDVRNFYLRETDLRTTCHEKGEATFFDIVVGVDINRHAAWQYRKPRAIARAVASYVAFWRGVTLVESFDRQSDEDAVCIRRERVQETASPTIAHA